MAYRHVKHPVRTLGDHFLRLCGWLLGLSVIAKLLCSEGATSTSATSLFGDNINSDENVLISR